MTSTKCCVCNVISIRLSDIIRMAERDSSRCRSAWRDGACRVGAWRVVKKSASPSAVLCPPSSDKRGQITIQSELVHSLCDGRVSRNVAAVAATSLQRSAAAATAGF